MGFYPCLPMLVKKSDFENRIKDLIPFEMREGISKHDSHYYIDNSFIKDIDLQMDLAVDGYEEDHESQEKFKKFFIVIQEMEICLFFSGWIQKIFEFMKSKDILLIVCGIETYRNVGYIPFDYRFKDQLFYFLKIIDPIYAWLDDGSIYSLDSYCDEGEEYAKNPPWHIYSETLIFNRNYFDIPMNENYQDCFIESIGSNLLYITPPLDANKEPIPNQEKYDQFSKCSKVIHEEFLKIKTL